MREKGCQLCNMAPNEFFTLMDGYDFSVDVMRDTGGEIYFVGEDNVIGSDPYYPKYCPECGRKLRD